MIIPKWKKLRKSKKKSGKLVGRRNKKNDTSPTEEIVIGWFW